MKLWITVSEIKEIYKATEEKPEQLFEMIRFDIRKAVWHRHPKSLHDFFKAAGPQTLSDRDK